MEETSRKPRRIIGRRAVRVLKRVLICLLVLAVIAGGAFGYLVWRSTHLAVTEDSYYAKMLPSAFYGYRIMCIADFADSPLYSEVAKRVNEERPDLVLFVGNMVRYPKEYNNLLALLGEIDSSIPKCAVFGAQEVFYGNQQQLKRILEEQGLRCLTGEKLTIERGGDSIDIIGITEILDAELSGSMELEQARQLLSAEIDPNRFTLVAQRRSTLYPALSGQSAALMISSYNSDFEFLASPEGAVYKADAGLFPDYARGFYGEGSMELFVSGSASPVSSGLSILDRPELTILTLKR